MGGMSQSQMTYAVPLTHHHVQAQQTAGCVVHVMDKVLAARLQRLQQLIDAAQAKKLRTMRPEDQEQLRHCAAWRLTQMRRMMGAQDHLAVELAKHPSTRSAPFD